MPKYLVDVFENWHRKYEIDATSEEDAIVQYGRLKKDAFLRYVEIEGPQYIDDVPSDSWIVERIEDE